MDFTKGDVVIFCIASWDLKSYSANNDKILSGSRKATFKAYKGFIVSHVY